MSLILFEDEHLLVIDKPAGWNTHAPSPFAGEGVYDWLKHREPRWAKLAIIHRLDKETSGVMVFGKTSLANRSLTEQFASRSVRKKYLLQTDRRVEGEAFIAASTIVRAGDKYVSRPLRAGGERAETRFTVAAVQEGCTRVEAEPTTGRTHQIRVHAAGHGFPILGDTLYGGTKAERVFLHSAALSFEHPATHAPATFSAPCDWSAMGARAGVIDPQLTNAFRVVHGAGDGWPGLHLERLGDFLLVESDAALTPAQRERVEAEARWHGSRGVYHKQLKRNVRRANTEESSPQFVSGERAPERFSIRENGPTFELSFDEGYSVGLFLDQRDNRRRFLANHVAAEFPLFVNGAAGAEVLNAFAYTCGFSVAAAQAGARTTSLDLSKKYLAWGKRNFVQNNLELAGHDFIYGDAFDWMQRLAKRNRAFDCVILDPPTFSHSKESGPWQAGKDYGRLAALALPLLKPGGTVFASTNAAKLEPEKFLAVIHDAVAKAGRKILQQHYAPQPPDFPITRAEPAYLKTVWLRIS